MYLETDGWEDWPEEKRHNGAWNILPYYTLTYVKSVFRRVDWECFKGLPKRIKSNEMSRLTGYPPRTLTDAWLEVNDCRTLLRPVGSFVGISTDLLIAVNE